MKTYTLDERENMPWT